MKSLYAEVHTAEQPDDSVHTKQQLLFVHAYWHFIKVDQANMSVPFNEGLKLLNRDFDQSYEAVEVSVTIERKTFWICRCAAQMKVRIYRIGDHNQVYSEVCEYQNSEHYVTYHEVNLDEDEGLKLVCAMHFERLGEDLPFAGHFYYANWWFAQKGVPVEDQLALSRIGCDDIAEVSLLLDGVDGEIRHEEVQAIEAPPLGKRINWTR